MVGKSFHTTGFDKNGSVPTARPSLKIDAIMFWLVTMGVGLLVVYQLGYDNGFDAGRITPSECPDRSPDGKKLSSLSFDQKNNITTCTYIRDTYGRGKWQTKV